MKMCYKILQVYSLIFPLHKSGEVKECTQQKLQYIFSISLYQKYYLGFYIGHLRGNSSFYRFQISSSFLKTQTQIFSK